MQHKLYYIQNNSNKNILLISLFGHVTYFERTSYNHGFGLRHLNSLFYEKVIYFDTSFTFI